MFINFIFNVFITIVEGILGVIPNLDFATFYGVWENIAGILRSVCYFLPMPTVAAIWTIIVILFNLRISIATIKTVWGLLPLA